MDEWSSGEGDMEISQVTWGAGGLTDTPKDAKEVGCRSRKKWLTPFVQFISHYSLHHCFSSVVQFSSSLSLFNFCLFIFGNRNIGIVGQQACFRSVCCCANTYNPCLLVLGSLLIIPVQIRKQNKRVKTLEFRK